MCLKEKTSFEKHCLARLRQGDESALRSIFDQNYQMLLGEAFKITADRAVSKDVAQDVFLELWKRRETLNIQISLEAYLRRAVRNRALNFLKTQKKYLFDDFEIWENETNHEPAASEKFQENQELVEALHAAISDLPEKCRVVFTLSRFDDLSHKEIAARLDISVKTIENQITKALRTLREKLCEHPDLSAIIILWVHFWGK